MPVTFNNLVNDSGSNLDGTLIDKAEFQALLMGTFSTKTDTGAVNNWAAGVDGHTFVEWSGASDAAFTGMAGGVTGLQVTVRNTGTKIATFAHNSGSSSVGNKFLNCATSGVTPVAPSGWIQYQYDGSFWQLIGHEQGAFITPAFSAGNFTANGAMTWTVASGDVTTYKYKLSGRELTVELSINTTTVAGTPNTQLNIAVPGGFTATSFVANLARMLDNGAAHTGTLDVAASGTVIRASTDTTGGTNWAAATDTTYVIGWISFEVT